MKTILRLLKLLFIVAFLSLLTQVGGLIFILFLPLSFLIRKKISITWQARLTKVIAFLAFYLIISLLIIPPLASINGRVPLPWFASSEQAIRPHNWMTTCLLNRHYVSPELKEVVLRNVEKMQRENPDFKAVYLDGSFPFWEDYPLWPHLSHDDGKKLDLGFVFENKKSGNLAKTGPGCLGYGVCQAPRAGESDVPAWCAEKGYWQYSLMYKLMPQHKKGNKQMNEALTKSFLQNFARDPAIHKIFIELHLEERLGLTKYQKIRQAGCHSVRHDDHIHIQVY